MRGRPTFTVVVAATVEERRLIPVTVARALTGLSESDIGDDGLALMIDGALASAARYCKLATAGAQPPTFARETVRASWPAATAWWHGGNKLVLPWRVPITSVEMTEAGAALEQDVDFRYLGGGVIERQSCWQPSDAIAVDYVAGWLPTSDSPTDYDGSDGEPLPADLVMLIAEQVRLQYAQRGMDPTLRSEDVPGVWSGTYSVVGGDSITAYGLSLPLQTALDAYRLPSFA